MLYKPLGNLLEKPFTETRAGFVELSCYLAKQRHVLLEKGYVEEHRKVVEEGELREERKEPGLRACWVTEDVTS